MKVYVGGASLEIDLIEKMIGDLLEQGVQITHDWTEDIRHTSQFTSVPESYRRACAVEDLHGVAKANLVWILSPPADIHSIGCWVEMGYAIAKQKPVLISGPLAPSNIFALLDSVRRYDKHEEAFDHILRAHKSLAALKVPIEP
jgi:hypothetical protein